MSNEPTRMASRATMPPREIIAVSDVPPPMSTTMLPEGLVDGQAGADGGGHGLGDQLGVGGAGLAGRLLDRPPLDLGDGRRHAEQHPWPLEPGQPGPLEQEPDHALGDLEVGDGALAQGAHGLDVAGRAPDHLPGLVAHGQHVVGLDVEGDHGRLVEDDAPALGVDEGVGRAQVDGEVPSQSGGLLRSVPRPRRSAGGAEALGGVGRVGLGLGRQGLELAGEGPDVGVDRPRRPVAQPQDDAADQAQHQGDAEEERALTGPPIARATSAAIGAGAAGRPVLAARPRLPLPDGHGGLEGVDAEAGGVEGLVAVGRGRHDDHRRLADAQVAGAVEQDEAPDVGPAAPGSAAMAASRGSTSSS